MMDGDDVDGNGGNDDDSDGQCRTENKKRKCNFQTLVGLRTGMQLLGAIWFVGVGANFRCKIFENIDGQTNNGDNNDGWWRRR